MRSIVFIIACGILLTGCQRSFEANETLSKEEYQKILSKVAPYVIAKSDEFSYKERFLPGNKQFYDNFIKLTGGEIIYFKEVDSASLFFFKHRDLTSLYEHYRGLGGYFRTNEEGEITFMNVLCHTPRLTKEEMSERGKLLFEEMLYRGNVKAYLGNKQFIHTPNEDFYYNTKLNRWDYTENSSWKFLQEAKDRAQPDSIR